MYTETNEIVKLAREFSARLAACIGSEKLYLAAYLNERDADKCACHTHDFCDANQVFIHTLEAHGIQYGAPKFDGLIGPVWDCAKLFWFFLDYCPDWTPPANKKQDRTKSAPALTIEHSFFPGGALAFIVGSELVFLYPDTIDAGFFQVWHSCEPYTTPEALTKFLDECTTGEHAEQGTGTAGTFAAMISEIF